MGQSQSSILDKVWFNWKRVLRRVGTFQANVLLTLTYIVFVPLIAIPFKLLADPLRMKSRRRGFAISSIVDPESLEAARKQ